MAANETKGEPATERQIAALRAWHVQEEALAGITRQTASAWLSELVASFRGGQAHRPNIRERPPDGATAPVPVPDAAPTFTPASALQAAEPTPPTPAPLPRSPVPAPAPAPVPVPPPRGDEEDEEMEVLRKVVMPDASDVELRMVMSMARSLNLDPRRGQIHAFRVGGRPVVMVGIDGYRVIAEGTGEYDGQDPPKLEVAADGKLISATVTVYRKGMGRGVSATAWWDEYARDTPPWRHMPRVMLCKVAEALAIRKAFPRGLSGTYVPEEMDQAVSPAPLSPPRVELPAPSRGRPRREAAKVRPADPVPEEATSPTDNVRLAEESLRNIQDFLSDTTRPLRRREETMGRLHDLLSTWGVVKAGDLVALVRAPTVEPDVAREIAQDLASIAPKHEGG